MAPANCRASLRAFLNLQNQQKGAWKKLGGHHSMTRMGPTDSVLQDSIKGNFRALATVTAIIDGTGSIGAALGPLLASHISIRGWNNVFLMLIVSSFLAALLLICVAKTEIQQKFREGKWVCNSMI
ncbi:hypothetical protein QYF36_007398 [Acer negundo]|nr:hypothetical protein QYF36_007398 [Acer negundo]